MLKTRHWIAHLAAFAVATVAYEPQNAQARPRYLAVFNEMYPDLGDSVRSPTSCVVCHIGTDKTKRTLYGIAVEDALGSRNVKDKDAIKAALKKAEGSLPDALP